MAYKKTDMTLIFPAETGYNNLKVEKFVPDTSKGNILVEREGIGGISLGFDNTEISVTGGSWFDLGISFGSRAFYAFTSEYSLISCNAETRECFLGTNMERVIGGPTAINPLSTWTRPNVNPSIACGTDSDCPAGRFCDTDITKKCIIRAQCKKIDSVSGSGGIAIVFAGYGFSSESTLRAMAEQAASRLLQISPFKEYKERFTFWELMPPRSFSPSNSRLLKLQCPQSEIAVILTQYGYGASIAGGGGSILGDVSVDVSVSRGASMNYIDQMKIVHELNYTALGLRMNIWFWGIWIEVTHN